MSRPARARLARSFNAVITELRLQLDQSKRAAAEKECPCSYCKIGAEAEAAANPVKARAGTPANYRLS